MKKFFLFAASAVALTVSCQKLQELVNPGTEPVDDTNPVEIKFNTNVVNVETKAALTALTSDHTLYIYGLNTTNLNDGVDPKHIINAPATTSVSAGTIQGTAGTSSAITWVGDDVHYYYRGTDDKYEFYGYYVATAAGATPTPDPETYKLPITITGQEDILLAKTVKADDIQGKKYANGSEVQEADVYSAKTARADVVPNLKFEHLLSQFTFKVQNGGKTAMTLKGISIETLNTGILTVAGSDAGLVAKTDSYDEFSLPNFTEVELPGKSGETLTEIDFDDASIMAFPAQASYKVNLYLWQSGAVAEGKVRKVSIPVVIDNGAEAGSSYEITATIYSLEEVSLTASLVSWENGDAVNIDTENTTGNDNIGEDGISEGEVEWPLTPTPSPTTPTFEVYNNPGTQTMTSEAYEFEVVIEKEDDTVNVTAEVTAANPENDPEWITVTVSENGYTVSVTENTTAAERTATITFSDGAGTTETLSVNQATTI